MWMVLFALLAGLAPAEAAPKVIARSIAEGAEHENTTTEGSFVTYEFPAYFWQVGKVVEFDAAVVVNDNNSTDTLTVYARLGASIAGTAIFTSSAVDSEDADIAVIHGTLTCRSIGTTGVVVASVLGSDPDAAGIPMEAHSKVVTVDTTAASTLYITGDWSVAHADNEAAAQSFVVQVLN